MNDDRSPDAPRSLPGGTPAADQTLGMSALYKLFESFIALREKNERQHKLFEQSLTKSRDTIQASFNSFAADTQRAYQQLRQEIHGEKKLSLVLLNELLEIGQELEHIVAARPPLKAQGEEAQALARWGEALEVECRKVQAALNRHGIHPYDAVIGSPYNPALHERVGGKRMEGMDPLRIAEQVEHGYASQQPEFVLRRPKVIVSE
jgi:molecular chaperone GrpE (heat shock protein)